MSADDGQLIATNQDQAAWALGFKDRSGLKPYFARGCPGGNGRYPIREMVVWFRENVWGQPATSPQRVGGDDLNDHDSSLQQRMELAEVLKTEADAAQRIVKLRKSLGELVEWAAIEARVRDEFNIIRHRLQDLPERVCNVIPLDVRSDVQLEVSNVIFDLLRGMATCQQDCAALRERPEESSIEELTSGSSRDAQTASTPSSARSPRGKSRHSSRGRRKT